MTKGLKINYPVNIKTMKTKYFRLSLKKSFKFVGIS